LFSFLALWVLSIQAGSWSGSVHVPASGMVWVSKQLPVIDSESDNVRYPIVGIQTKVASVMDTTAEGFHLKVQHTLWHKNDNNQMNGGAGKNEEDLQFKTPESFKPVNLKNRWSPCDIQTLLGSDTNLRSLILGSDFKTNETLSLDVSIEIEAEDSFLPTTASTKMVPLNPVNYMTYVPSQDGDINVVIQKRQEGVPPISSVFSSLSIGCGQPPHKEVSLSAVDQDSWNLQLRVAGGQPVFFALRAVEDALRQPISYVFRVDGVNPPGPFVDSASMSVAPLFTLIFGCAAFFLVAVIVLAFLFRA